MTEIIPISNNRETKRNVLSSLKQSRPFRAITFVVNNFSLAAINFCAMSTLILLSMIWFAYDRIIVDKFEQKQRLSYYINLTLLPLGTLFYFWVHLNNSIQRHNKLFGESVDENKHTATDLSSNVIYSFLAFSSIFVTSLNNFNGNLDLFNVAFLLGYISVFFVFWYILRKISKRMVIEIFEYRSERSKFFVDSTLFIFSSSGLIEMFFILAMISEYQSMKYSNLSLPDTWSAGYATLGGTFNITGSCVLWTYTYGSGLLTKEDFQFLKVSENYGNDEYNKVRNILVSFLKYLVFLDLGGFIYCVSMTWTTFDAIEVYYGIFCGFIMWLLAGLVVGNLRSMGPKTLKTLLWHHEKKFHFFISHAQSSGGDQVHSLTKELQIRGCTVWWDQELETEISEETMKNGISMSMVVVVFLTRYSMERYFTQIEVRHAINEKLPLIVMIELDQSRPGAYQSIEQCICEMDDEFKNVLFSYELIVYSRRKYLSEAMYDEMIRRLKSFYN